MGGGRLGRRGMVVGGAVVGCCGIVELNVIFSRNYVMFSLQFEGFSVKVMHRPVINLD